MSWEAPNRANELQCMHNIQCIHLIKISFAIRQDYFLGSQIPPGNSAFVPGGGEAPWASIK